MLGFDAPSQDSSFQGHGMTATLGSHPGRNRLASQTTTSDAGGNAILTSSTNIDLLGRT